MQAEYAIDMAKNAITLVIGGWSISWVFSPEEYGKAKPSRVESIFAPAIAVTTSMAVSWNYITDTKISNSVEGTALLAGFGTFCVAWKAVLNKYHKVSTMNLAAVTCLSIASAAGSSMLAQYDVTNMFESNLNFSGTLDALRARVQEQDPVTVCMAAIGGSVIGAVATLATTRHVVQSQPVAKLTKF